MARVKNAFHDEISGYCPDHGSRCDCDDRPEVEIDPAAHGLHFDRWTGQYHDQFNDVWVRRRPGRKLWIVAFRDYGNVTRIVSRHRDLLLAFVAAADVIAKRAAQ